MVGQWRAICRTISAAAKAWAETRIPISRWMNEYQASSCRWRKQEATSWNPNTIWRCNAFKVQLEEFSPFMQISNRKNLQILIQRETSNKLNVPWHTALRLRLLVGAHLFIFLSISGEKRKMTWPRPLVVANRRKSRSIFTWSFPPDIYLLSTKQFVTVAAIARCRSLPPTSPLFRSAAGG